MIDSKTKPGPGTDINTNKKGSGLQKEEPDGAPDCLKEKDQVWTRTAEALELDCADNKVVEVMIVLYDDVD